MTIAISLKVNDGLVLAADSASTFVQPGVGITNIYNNANKVFNLYKGRPIGLITWGTGGIGQSSISTLVKDLRVLLTDGHDPKYEFNPDSYQVQDVAEKVAQFMLDRYLGITQDERGDQDIGFIVAGYSSGESMAEEYQIVLKPVGTREGPDLLRPKGECGVSWNGVRDPLTRILLGHGEQLAVVLKDNLGVPEGQVAAAVAVVENALSMPFIAAAMPFQDAIDLSEFLVNTGIGWSRFSPGAPTVGGPVEIAAISKHEGFKWVQRKHYYDVEFNPPTALDVAAIMTGMMNPMFRGFGEHIGPALEEARRIQQPTTSEAIPSDE